MKKILLTILTVDIGIGLVAFAGCKDTSPSCSWNNDSSCDRTCTYDSDCKHTYKLGCINSQEEVSYKGMPQSYGYLEKNCICNKNQCKESHLSPGRDTLIGSITFAEEIETSLLPKEITYKFKGTQRGLFLSLRINNYRDDTLNINFSSITCLDGYNGNPHFFNISKQTIVPPHSAGGILSASAPDTEPEIGRYICSLNAYYDSEPLSPEFYLVVK